MSCQLAQQAWLIVPIYCVRMMWWRFEFRISEAYFSGALAGRDVLDVQRNSALQDHLTRGGDTSSPWQSIVLRLSLSDETAIAPTLERLNAGMHDMLAVGSYPVSDQVWIRVLQSIVAACCPA